MWPQKITSSNEAQKKKKKLSGGGGDFSNVFKFHSYTMLVTVLDGA